MSGISSGMYFLPSLAFPTTKNVCPRCLLGHGWILPLNGSPLAECWEGGREGGREGGGGEMREGGRVWLPNKPSIPHLGTDHEHVVSSVCRL